VKLGRGGIPIWTAILSLAWAITPAAADLPGPDALGVYFDAEGASSLFEISEPSVVDLYLLLTNPTMETLAGWETALTFSGGAAVTGVDYPSGSQPVLAGPSDWSASFATPLPCGVLTKLAVFQVQFSGEIDTQIFLGGVEAPAVPGDLPAVRPADQDWRAVDVASGDPGQPVAAISLPTPVEHSLWGGVKLLYR
jgi:hypothetical protein